MKRKVSTVMEEALFRRAKLEAARQGRPMSSLLEDALSDYLDDPRRGLPVHRTVAETWGAFALPPDVLREIMEEDDDDLDG